MRTLKIVVSTAVVALTLVLPPGSTIANEQKPLSAEDLKRLTRDGIPESRLGELVERLGISFAPTRDALSELTRSGVPAAVVNRVAKQIPRGQSRDFYMREGDRLNQEGRMEEASAHYRQAQEVTEDESAAGETPAVAEKPSNSLARAKPPARASSSSTPARQAGKGWLGAVLEDAVFSYQGQQLAAIEVGEVAPSGPAARAGLEEGDYVVSIQGRAVKTADEVRQAIAALPPGTQASIEVLKDEDRMTLAVTLAAAPKGRLAEQVAPPREDDGGPAASNPLAAAAGRTSTGIFINNHELPPQQVKEIIMTYGYAAPPGRYWYDPVSGLWGLMGREAAGFLRPNHNFGALPPNASNGNTGVIINGRELNMVEALYCQQIFGAVYRGRWWLDGRTGNIGQEGNPMPLGNVFAALQQAQQRAQGGGGYGWHSKATGAYGNSSGGCSYVSIPGATGGTTTATSGCD